MDTSMQLKQLARTIGCRRLKLSCIKVYLRTRLRFANYIMHR